MAIDVHPGELHRLTIGEYHQLVRAGGLDEDTRVELLDGLLVDMSPKTPQHENAVAWLADWLRDRVDRARQQVRVSSPLTIGGSEPEPDLAVVATPSPRDAHPATAQFVIEVSHSSLRRDLHEKPALYALGGVGEYWVVDLDGRRVVRHSDPHDGAYGEVTEYGPDATLPATGIDPDGLPVAALLDAIGL